MTSAAIKETPLLQARNLKKSYGGLEAVAGMDIDVPRGQITGLIGPNGAGKTTMLNMLSGVEQPNAGVVSLGTRDITGMPSYRLAALGLVRTFQICRDLGRLTVLENLLVARAAQKGETIIGALVRPRVVALEEKQGIDAARVLLERVGLWRLADAPAASLSGGQKKLLELSRALMLKPRIVLLDEPAAGVAPAMEAVLVKFIRELVDEGLTFLIVEHDLDVVAALCDEVYVMAGGRLLTRGTFADVTADSRVLEAYLGVRA